MKPIILILLLFYIYCTTTDLISQPNRHLEEITQLYFLNASNLLYNSEKKQWGFIIKYYSSTPIENDKEYTVSILFNEEPSFSSCISNTANSILNCTVKSKTKLNLIRLNNERKEANIEWKNLTTIYDIPIICSLIYEDIYSLTYVYQNGYYHFSFEIDLLEKVLPQDGLVNIDIKFGDTLLISQCYGSYYKKLYCKFKLRSENNWIVQLMPKISGSADWVNINNKTKVYIPIQNIINTVFNSFDLQFIDLKWHFKLKLRPQYGRERQYLTMNVKTVKPNGDENIYLTKCISYDYNRFAYDSLLYLDCVVEGENQDILDLVYISNTTEYHASVTYERYNLISCKNINRLATLKFIKAYDFYNYSSIKILVGDDQNLPNKALVNIDIICGSSSYSRKCTYSNHILTCEFKSDSSSVCKINNIKYSGSVIWNNLREKTIAVPKNHKLNFVSAHGLFYTDKWNFIIKYTNADSLSLADHMIVLIDIIHNNEEVTATCDVKNTYKNDMICTSDYDAQSPNDKIKLKKYMKYGTIDWKMIIQDDTIPKAVAIEPSLLSFEFRDAFDMYFSKTEKKWMFSIYAGSVNQANEGTVIVDILVQKLNGNIIESTATCLVCYTRDANYAVRLLCRTNYENQEKTDLLKINPNKVNENSIEWTNSDKIKNNNFIKLKTELFLKKYSWNTINNRRLYNITVKDDDEYVLPIGSKLSLGLEYGALIKKINCTAETKNFIFCNASYADGGYPLSNLISSESSVTWLNDKDDKVFYVIKTLESELVSADKLYFNDTEKKWYFNLTISSEISRKRLCMDILYNENPEIALCYIYVNILNCFVDLVNQDKKAKIKLTNMKSTLSTLTWTNSVDDVLIPIWTELTLEQVGNLKWENDKWNFELKVKEENIPEDSLVILDLYTVYQSLYLETFEGSYTIDCIYNNKIINCSTDEISYSHSMRIITKKNPFSKSTVYKWNNVGDLEKISLNLEMNLGFYFSSRIYKDKNEKYVFYIETETYTPSLAPCTIDLLIGNKNYLTTCLTDYYGLNCEIDEEKYLANMNNIYLSKTKSSESSITWNNLEEDQFLFPVKFKFVHAYNKKPLDISNDDEDEVYYHYINILIDEDNIESKNIKFSVYFLHIYKDSKEYYFDNAYLCEKKNLGILNCSINYFGDEFDIILVGNDTFSIVDWINPDYYANDDTELYIINYKSLLYCIYDKENKFYNFEMKITFGDENTPNPKKFVMDVLINENYEYALCTIIEGEIYDCRTRTMQKEENHKIKIMNGPPINGNSELKNFPDDFIIYPNDAIFVKVSYIYDLTFNNNNNKWEFKIKSENDIQIDQYKTLDILIDDNLSIANCKTNNDIIECMVNSENQNNNQLIKISPDYVFKDNVYLSNLKQYNIPLRAQFEFISSENIKYNNSWSFNIKVSNKDDNFIIPSESLFSLDIIYDTDKTDLAFCTIENKDNNQLTLLCTPQNDIQNNSLITLSNNEKSTFASINFNPALSEKNKYIYFSTELNVTQVYMTESENNNNFYMTFANSINIPLNGRIILDLTYNDEDAIAYCILIQKNKFECYPDIDNQNPDDIFSISPYIKYATVTFINSGDKLKFLNILNFVKAYNLKYDNEKWSFKILLGKSKIKNGKSFDINILIDDDEATSNCIYNNDILSCDINNQNQDRFNIIKLINDYNTETVWINLPDELIIYNENEIRLINIYGGFYNKKWNFNIYYTSLNKNSNFYNLYYILDILVNNNIESTAICQSMFSSFLKCVANYENQNINDKILIDVNKEPKLGTITFQKLQVEPQKIIDYISFGINYQINSGYYNQEDKVEIIIEGTLQRNLEYDIEEDTVTMIELVQYKNGNKNYMDVTCMTNNIKKNKGSYVYMICETDLNDNKDKIEINIGDNKYSKYVQFSQSTNIEILFDKNWRK